MRLGVMLPLADIGGEPGTVRDFALAAEQLGYTNLGLPDHVLSGNPAAAGGPEQRALSAGLYQDPFVCSASWPRSAGRRRNSRPRS